MLVCLMAMVGMPAISQATTPSETRQTGKSVLLVVDKGDNSLVLIDPISLKSTARIPVGTDPHEVTVSSDGKTAYVSNYGGPGSNLKTIAVIDMVTAKALPSINLGPLHSAHGLAFAGGKLYFTAETNKVIGRYDPAAGQVDWVLGTGQNRNHLLIVTRDGKQFITSNIGSDSVSIISQVVRTAPPPGGPGQGGGGGRQGGNRPGGGRPGGGGPGGRGPGGNTREKPFDPSEEITKKVDGFVLKCPVLEGGRILPIEYTGDGASISPPLEWSGAPAVTRSFAVIMHHLDPQNLVKVYWTLYNLPETTHSLPKNVKGMGTNGRNTINNILGYAPPHSQGPGEKTYVITVYALSEAPMPAGSVDAVNRSVLLAAMKGHVLGTAELKVVYTRKDPGR